jgi:hypothetical protein
MSGESSRVALGEVQKGLAYGVKLTPPRTPHCSHTLEDVTFSPLDHGNGSWGPIAVLLCVQSTQDDPLRGGGLCARNTPTASEPIF